VRRINSINYHINVDLRIRANGGSSADYPFIFDLIQ
jgi:hypothetical protein